MKLKVKSMVLGVLLCVGWQFAAFVLWSADISADGPILHDSDLGIHHTYVTSAHAYTACEVRLIAEQRDLSPAAMVSPALASTGVVRTGGPDAFGYTFQDGVTFSWVDATSGSPGPASDDT